MHDFENIKKELDGFKNGDLKHGNIKFVSIVDDTINEFSIKSILYDELNDTDDSQCDGDINKIWKSIDSKIERRRNIRTLSIWVSRIAAVVIIAMAAYFGFNNESQEVTMVETQVPFGSSTMLKLPDGTYITLNSGSVLKYPSKFSKNSRDVYLNGEGYFEVTHDESQPFIVHANEIKVKVLGTKFNVSSFSNDSEISTVLFEGKVNVDNEAGTYLNKDIQMSPSQMLVINKRSGKVELKNLEKTNIYKSWIENKLVFKNIEFAELVKKLERKYGVQIIIRSKSLKSYHFDGTFEKETIKEVLKIISETLPIKYKIEGKVIIISKR